MPAGSLELAGPSAALRGTGDSREDPCWRCLCAPCSRFDPARFPAGLIGAEQTSVSADPPPRRSAQRAHALAPLEDCVRRGI